jgi:transposase InsO family protein
VQIAKLASERTSEEQSKNRIEWVRDKEVERKTRKKRAEGDNERGWRFHLNSAVCG